MIVNRQILDSCICAISVATDLPAKAITGGCRYEEIVFARHLLWWVLATKFHYPITAIARAVKRDRTALTYAVDRINQIKPHDRRYLLIQKISDHVKALEVLSFEKCVGMDVVLQSRVAGVIREGRVEQVPPIGDAVKLNLKGGTGPEWASRRDWVVLGAVNRL